MHPSVIQKFLCTSATLFFAASLTACGGGRDDDDKQIALPAAPTIAATTTGGARGKVLYTTYCVACHSVGAKSSATVAANTLNAIASIGAMKNLNGAISQADAADMALYLANPAGF
jgi:mono/diheme cytochrome c family protein